jgi:hypothetical protein
MVLHVYAAAPPSAGMMALISVISLVFLVLLGAGILLLKRWFDRRALAALWRNYEGLAIRHLPKSGDVQVVFHTYHGFLAYFVQSEHRFAAAPDEALELLRRLHRHNCRWGLLAPGCVYIPSLSLYNYWQQCRQIRTQMHRPEEQNVKASPGE